MYTDARISAGLETMVRGIDAPPVPLSAIQRKIEQAQAAARHPLPFLRLGIATAGIIAVISVVFPSYSLSFVQTIEARYRAALQERGGIAPPPVPESLVSTLRSQSATLAAAQSRVPFTIVAPAGLPNDITSSKIVTTATGVYSKINHSWRVGSPAVSFIYRRTHGRSFTLQADRFDPQDGMPPKYMFLAEDPAPDGQPVLVRHENVAWRNGSQIMTVIEDENISAPEIEAIRVAMQGVTVPRRELHASDSGTLVKFYRIPAP